MAGILWPAAQEALHLRNGSQGPRDGPHVVGTVGREWGCSSRDSVVAMLPLGLGSDAPAVGALCALTQREMVSLVTLGTVLVDISWAGETRNPKTSIDCVTDGSD